MSVRWFNKYTYTSKEIEQIEFLQTSYTQTFGGELPLELGFEREKKLPSYSPQRANFQKTFWLEKLGKGPLKYCADQILGLICTYQQRRSERMNFVNSGYPNDPTNLFCEEFKGWLVHTLSKVETWTGGETGNMKQVKQRMQFLNLVLRSRMFPPEKYCDMTLNSLIVETRMVLEEKVMPKIIAEIASHSAREHLRVLTSNATDILMNGVQVLISIFRGTHLVDQSYSLGSLVEPCRKEFLEILNTDSGKLLQRLESSELFSEIFSLKPQNTIQTETTLNYSYLFSNPFLEKPESLETSLPTSPTSPTSPNKLLTSTSSATTRGGLNHPSNPFSNEFNESSTQQPESDSLLALSSNLLKFSSSAMLGPKPVLSSHDQIVAMLSQQRSGIEALFRNRVEVLKEFVNLHGWLYEIASLILVFEQSRKLAGVGGNLLVYGLANSTLNNLLNFLEQILQKTKKCVEKLFEYGNVQHLSLVRLNNGKGSWIKNFNHAVSYKDGLIMSINGCSESSGEVRHQANKVSPGGRLEKAKKETESFLEIAQGVMQHQASLLNIQGFDLPLEKEKSKLQERNDLQEIEYHEVVQISQPQNQQSQSQPKLQQLGTKDESIIEEISSHSIPMPDSGKDEQSTKVEEEKLMWFLEQIQGDASFGGSSYQFDEEELEQIQHSNTETFETEKEKLMKEREQERREKERILKEKNEEKKGLKNKLKIRRRKKQPSTQEPKPKQPTPKIEKVLSKKFKKFQKPSSHSSPFPPICEKDDLETNQMLQENARKKQEAAIQEKLQLLMSSQGESSTYQFEENEKVLLDQKDLEKRTIDQAQKNLEISQQSEESLFQQKLKSFLQDIGNHPYEYSTYETEEPEFIEEEATTQALFQQKLALFNQKRSHKQEFSTYSDDSMNENLEQEKDDFYMKQAPVYDEATAMEIFNQKLALFSQKIELSPDSDISSYEKAPREKNSRSESFRQPKQPRKGPIEANKPQPRSLSERIQHSNPVSFEKRLSNIGKESSSNFSKRATKSDDELKALNPFEDSLPQTSNQFPMTPPKSPDPISSKPLNPFETPGSGEYQSDNVSYYEYDSDAQEISSPPSIDEKRIQYNFVDKKKSFEKKKTELVINDQPPLQKSQSRFGLKLFGL